MLVWFMHGASVRRPEYADPLRSRLIAAFSAQGLALPEFYSCFWGDLFGSASELWDWVQEDLEAFKWDYPQIEIDDVFHYRSRREQLVDGFFNDIFNYLNPERGWQVRRVVALQFLNWLADTPLEEDLHIVAHSLGSVILWDMLFSDRLSANDPAFYVRNRIKGLSGQSDGRKVKLRSLTTLGCPLLYFNRGLGVHPDRLKQFASRYQQEPLRWVNVIHASDIFAYPIRASLQVSDLDLYLHDHYLGERNFLKKNVGDFAMALGLAADHSRYWRSSRVARLVMANLLGDYDTLSQLSPILEMGEFDD